MTEEQTDRLLKAVQTIAISPADAKEVVRRLRGQSERKHPGDAAHDHQERVADHIVSRYSRHAATSGGVTALAGVIPGIGTAVAVLAGSATDIAVSMKLQVDMCMCLAETFGYDLHEPDARHLAFLIAAGGALEKAGVEGGVKVASKAGVTMLRQYMKGAALQVIKELFKKLGITFTRKALEKALPFGIGVVFGAGGNYAMTKFVGKQAKQWFLLDRDTPRDESAAAPTGPDAGPSGSEAKSSTANR
jgi:hypothetical protein